MSTTPTGLGIIRRCAGSSRRALSAGWLYRHEPGGPANRVVVFYNQRGTAEQSIKAGKNALRRTRLSCRAMKANAVRLQLHALAYNLANFLRTLALPKEAESWSLTTIREKLVKIGAKVITHARGTLFQMAEVVVSRDLFAGILAMIDDLRQRTPAPC